MNKLFTFKGGNFEFQVQNSDLESFFLENGRFEKHIELSETKPPLVPMTTTQNIRPRGVSLAGRKKTLTSVSPLNKGNSKKFKISFSEKATKFVQCSSLFEHLLIKRPNHEEDYAYSYGFLKKVKL